METPQSKSKDLPNFLIPMTDLRQTKEYARYMEQLGWKVVASKQNSVTSIQVFIKKIPFLGCVVKIQRPKTAISLEAVDEIARKEKVAAVWFEPLSTEHYLLLTKAGFAKAKTCFLPAKTIQIDLAKSEKELLLEMKPKTRYNIRQAQRKGVRVVVVTSPRLQSPEATADGGQGDIESFVTLWHSSARRRGMFLSQKKEIKALWQSFGNKASLLLALDSKFQIPDSKPLAGVLVVRTAHAAHYMYAASTREGNKLFAPTLVAWEAIKLAKSARCKIFDFEGIYDERYKQTKNWKGFTRFKEGFGGKTVTYPGTFVKYYSPLAKFLRL